MITQPQQPMQERLHNEYETGRHTVVLEEHLVSPRMPGIQPVAQPQPASHARRDRVVAMVVALLVTGSVTVGGAVVGYEATRLPSPVMTAVQTSAPEDMVVRTPSAPHPFVQLSLQARAYVVYDVYADKILAASNKDTPMPIASLTKVMTSLVAMESSRTDTRLAIAPQAIETEGDSGLFANESWRLADLVSFTMLTSSNDGADAIASAVGSLWHSTPEMAPVHERVGTFVDQMNKRAREIGLVHTSYRNASGLDVSSGVPGGSGSAEDMARLFAYAWEHEPSVFSDTVQREQTFLSEDGFIHAAQNTNSRVEDVYGLLGSKTGYTDLAGGNLGIVYNSGMDHPIVIVVLGSTREGRFDDVEELVDATYEYIASGWYEYEVAGSTPRR